MTKLELCEGDTLLNAGAALFVNCGINELQMARFASDERLTFNDIKRYTGSIIELEDRAILYVADAMDWRVEFDGSLERKEYPEIPTDAVREAVINAFGHRIIESGKSVEVAIYKSFIEIYSPGKFPEGVTPQQFITEIRKPIRRNPRITRTLYYSKDMEIFATGLKRISDACSKAGVKVEFYGDEYGFTVRFYRHCGEGWSENHTSNILKNDIGDLREGDNKKNDFAQNERSLSEVLGEVLKKTDYEKVLPIITVLEGAGEITPREAEKICKKSPATVRRYLGLLVNSGYVISEGNTNNIVYKVIENI